MYSVYVFMCGEWAPLRRYKTAEEAAYTVSKWREAGYKVVVRYE
jgi:hypothetical protein